MPSRPNVLFLMDDEHRPDVLGYAGNDVVRTPNLDRLAADACIFENAYTPAPRCVPARQCVMTGELPMTCGCLSYGDGLDGDEPTYARRFREYGYRTAVAGKTHFVGGDALLGFGRAIGSVGNTENVDRKVELDYEKNKWSDVKEIKRAGIGHSGRAKGDEYTVTGAEHYVEGSFLDAYYDRAHPERPTFLQVSLVQPHYPYYAADEDAFNYHLNRVDPHIEEAPNHDGLSAREVTVGDDGMGVGGDTEDPTVVTEREIRRATAAYYAIIEYVDSLYGRVLDALEQAGEDLDEWIIVFCSDHGEMLGEHGVWEKGSFYEASAGVPLFIRWPERFDGKRIEANVNLTDLFATLCDLADLPVHEDEARDSRSLVPLLRGDETAWFDQHPDDEVISAEGDRVMVRRGELKYVHFPADGPHRGESWDDGDVLFDLDSDPRERTNLIDDPAYADAVTAFRNRVADLGYGLDADPDYVDAGYT